MGCDIHMFVEKKTKEGWESAEHYVKNKYFGMDDEPEYIVCNIYSHRNYGLFALLAGVRNYNDRTPISDPKGLPPDVTEFVKEQSDRWDGDGHSHSFLTLEELRLYDHHDCIEELIKKIQNRKNELNICGDDSDKKIRIVFWFDN